MIAARHHGVALALACLVSTPVGADNPGRQAGASPSAYLLAQANPAGSSTIEMLRQQPSNETRRRTIVPSAADGTGVPGAAAPPSSDADKLERVQRLIEEMEQRRGAERGTIKVRPAQHDGVRLEHDLDKMSRNFSAGVETPFGGSALLFPTPLGLDAGVTSADVEYRVNNDRTTGEQVIAVKRSGDVLGTAFRSGESPVSVEVRSVGLTAMQIPGSTPELPVAVTVGQETRQMAPGETARFGNIEVQVQTSANRSSAKPYLEGPPYAVRLQVRSVQ
jgi:hypothetical protein